MFEKRKYMDYELAYKGYENLKRILEEKGIEEIKNKFNDYCGYYCDDNRLINFYYEDYNTYLTLVKQDEKWFVSNEVEIISYGGCQDCLLINSKEMLEDRLNNIDYWAKEQDYSAEDIKMEIESIKKVLEKLA